MIWLFRLAVVIVLVIDDVTYAMIPTPHKSQKAEKIRPNGPKKDLCVVLPDEMAQII